MRAVPRGLLEAAYALGSTPLQVSFKVVIPAAFSGISASFVLAAARAIGETMIDHHRRRSAAPAQFAPMVINGAGGRPWMPSFFGTWARPAR